MKDLTESAIDVLEKLVSFNTVPDRSNLEIVAYIESYLDRFGIVSAIIHDDTGQKANIFATIGDPTVPGIVLSGHTDVVPVVGQVWERDPFTLSREGDKLYGRGTTDMKGYVACAMAIVPLLKAADLKFPVHLAFSYDEELGCLGVHSMIKFMEDNVAPPMAAFIGEPSSMDVVDAHKGIRGLVTRIKGLACHSSRTDLGASAISGAMKIVAELDRCAALLQDQPDPGLRFDLPYSTINVGLVKGGTARNLVPGDCEIHWEIRGIRPEVAGTMHDRIEAFTQTEVLPGLKARFADAAITTSIAYDVPALVARPGSVAETLAKTFAGRNETLAVNYGTEAVFFSQVGVPSVVCGPGSIEQAHIADEWIEVAEIRRCMTFMEDLVIYATR